jgi:hypothetical protein
MEFSVSQMPFIFEGDKLLASPFLTAWYAQNGVNASHPKIHPIPVGLPIHYGFVDSPHNAQCPYLGSLVEITTIQARLPRSISQILMDKGTTLFGDARASARLRAVDILQQCTDRVEMMQTTPTLETWTQHYRTHQFGVIVRGTWWDTYRLGNMCKKLKIPLAKYVRKHCLSYPFLVVFQASARHGANRSRRSSHCRNHAFTIFRSHRCCPKLD